MLRKSLFAAVLLLCSGWINAQNTTLSPFSRFGLGDLNTPLSSGQFAMGGVGTGLRMDQIINLSNPAATLFQQKTSFDVGIRYTSLNLANATAQQRLSSTAVNHFAYAFPVKNKYTLTAGLIPYSRIGYTLREKKNINDSLSVTNSYKGSGGLNRAFLGQAFRLYNRKDSTVLSAGANINFVFGTIGREARSVFPSNENYYNSRNLSFTTVKDLNFDLGLFFSTYPVPTKNIRLNVGATYSLSSTANAILENRIESYVTSPTTGNEFVVDTVSYLYDDNGKITLPQQFSLGTSVEINNKLTLALDYRTQLWSNYSQTIDNAVIRSNLRNTQAVHVGFDYTPKRIYVPNLSWFNYVSYRGGLRYDKQYVVINNTQLTGIGISGGLSLPLGKGSSLSRLSLGYELYQRGNLNQTQLKEQTHSLLLGIVIFPTANDRWFYKRKYD
ncbi:MAG TPA: hypothetical protein VFV37_02190 [Luteibaculaceae bacterium]|nr:hypothetical protein [Luteibaculaceae bacterium]